MYRVGRHFPNTCTRNKVLERIYPDSSDNVEIKGETPETSTRDTRDKLRFAHGFRREYPLALLLPILMSFGPSHPSRRMHRPRRL